MKQPQVVIYPISDILEWNENGLLSLTPKFQRRNVWSPLAKSYFIDTIVRSLPIPPIFVRPIIDVSSRRILREVVDGQQRLRTIIEYVNGDFTIMPVHNRNLANLPFSYIPEQVKRAIFEYKITTNLLENISDAEVLEVFSRINTYTVPLNPQELRNSLYLGPFKQAMYRIAHKHYQFFKLNGILTDETIARMDDAELISEVTIGILQGPTQTDKETIDEFYARYEDSFPLSDRLDMMFAEAFTVIDAVFGDNLRNTQFRRVPLFYSFLLIILENLYELEDKNALSATGIVLAKDDRRLVEKLRGVVAEVEKNFKSRPQDPAWRIFKGAMDRATANTKSRTIRDVYLRSLLAR
jgi:hypothetical protein